MRGDREREGSKGDRRGGEWEEWTKSSEVFVLFTLSFSMVAAEIWVSNVRLAGTPSLAWALLTSLFYPRSYDRYHSILFLAFIVLFIIFSFYILYFCFMFYYIIYSHMNRSNTKSLLNKFIVVQVNGSPFRLYK